MVICCVCLLCSAYCIPRQYGGRFSIKAAWAKLFNSLRNASFVQDATGNTNCTKVSLIQILLSTHAVQKEKQGNISMAATWDRRRSQFLRKFRKRRYNVLGTGRTSPRNSALETESGHVVRILVSGNAWERHSRWRDQHKQRHHVLIQWMKN